MTPFAEVFRPARPGRDAALAVEADRAGAHPAEVWEAMAARELITLAWVDDPDRRFAQGESPRELTLSPHPVCSGCCVAFAADVANVLAAEALARECVARLVPFGGPSPRTVAWRASVGRSLWETMPGTGAAESAARAEVRDRLVGVSPSTDLLADAYRPSLTLARLHQRYAVLWPQAVPTARIRYGHYAEHAGNPFEPLVAIWALGYQLELITAEAIVMRAPEYEW